MGTKKINGQYTNGSLFQMILYMNGSVFPKARYMNGIGFEILARTPVPKLPTIYILPLPRPAPPPPARFPPPPPTHTHTPTISSTREDARAPGLQPDELTDVGISRNTYDDQEILDDNDLHWEPVGRSSSYPSGHIAFIQHRINVDATS